MCQPLMLGPVPTPARREATPEEARALAHPLRLRVLRELYDGPLTNSELAARLGRDKATLLHHVRVLADTGFVEALPARRGTRGSREIPYRTLAKSWSLEVDRVAGRAEVEDAMVAAFTEEYAEAARLAPTQISRLALRLSDAEHAELVDRLGAVLQDFAARPPTPGGTPWAAFLSVHRRP